MPFTCGRGGIGIRARLRGVSGNRYGFKSRRPHISEAVFFEGLPFFVPPNERFAHETGQQENRRLSIMRKKAFCEDFDDLEERNRLSDHKNDCMADYKALSFRTSLSVSFRQHPLGRSPRETGPNSTRFSDTT